MQVEKITVDGQNLGRGTCILEQSGAVKINLASNDVEGVNRIDIITHISRVKLEGVTG